MFDRLKIENFTAFEKAEFQFVKGINVYVGENGSGKTHILKLLYALQKQQFYARIPGRQEVLSTTLTQVFKPDSVSRLVRRTRGNTVCDIKATWKSKTINVNFSRKQADRDMSPYWDMDIDVEYAPTFIPAKDILGHSVNFIQAYNTISPESRVPWLDFDVTYQDLLLAATDVPRGRVPTEQEPLLSILNDKMTGTVTQQENGRYYLNYRGSGQIEFPLVAEGWRKLGLMWILIKNGSFTKGNVLYWDEPEANLNPSMFETLAKILAIIADSGTQIHVATHSYAFLRELEFAMNGKAAGYRIFAMDRKPQGVAVESCDRFVEIQPNLILKEYERIFSLSMIEQIQRMANNKNGNAPSEERVGD